MSHWTRLRANLAAWVAGSAVLSSEFDALDDRTSKSINGDEGGLWSPSSAIQIGGSGLALTGPGARYGVSDFSASMQAQNWPERWSLSATGTLATRVPLCWDGSGSTGVNGGNLYVTFDSNGTAYTSGDGAIWRTHSTGGFIGIPCSVAAGLVSGSPGFVVADSGAIARPQTSPDGSTWTIRTGAGSGTASAVVYAKELGLWVMLGFGNLVTSPDGVTWTSRTLPANWIGGSSKHMSRIAWNGTRFIVTCTDSYAFALTSTDGIAWSEVSIGLTNAQTVAYGAYNGMWMITGGSNHISTSLDGLTWVASTPATLPGVASLNDLVAYKSLWIGPSGGGFFGGLYWSVDAGVTWQKTSVGDHTTSLQGYSTIIAADNRLVIARSSATALEFALSLRSN